MSNESILKFLYTKRYYGFYVLGGEIHKIGAKLHI